MDKKKLNRYTNGCNKHDATTLITHPQECYENWMSSVDIRLLNIMN